MRIIEECNPFPKTQKTKKRLSTERSSGMKPHGSMQELDPPIGETPIILIREKSMTGHPITIQQKIYLKDSDPIILRMRYQRRDIQFLKRR